MPVDQDLIHYEAQLKRLTLEIEQSDPLRELQQALKDKRNKSVLLDELVSREIRIKNILSKLIVGIRESAVKHKLSNSESVKLRKFEDMENVCKRLLLAQEVILKNILPESYKDIVDNLKTVEALAQKIQLCDKSLSHGEPRERDLEIRRLCLEALGKMKKQ